MKRIVPILITLAVIAGIIKTMLFLYGKSQTVPEVFGTEQASIRDIVRKTVATGSIVPRQQVEIKPRVSGVLEELLVEPGDIVKAGQKLATIKIIPNMINLNSAESSVKSARISFTSAKAEFARNQGLFDKGVISATELSQFRLQFKLGQQRLQSAQSNLQLIKSGASGGNKVSNVVTSTVDGMVIEVPPKEGASVTEANTFNAGTTIASIADMNDMIFEGKVDESEVGKIKVGMKLDIKIGAIDGKTFEGVLEYIAPKGASVDGAIQFELRAALTLKPTDIVRAGYSANADIVLKRMDKVLSISESVLRFDKESKEPYVEVETSPQHYERRDIEVGLSDGIYIEVVKGITESDKIKKLSAVRAENKGK
ncbi:MAG: efflux RND transporter periplasmic adaptor subunit [Kofleriaceae bacterium]|nr:efflux RND transporter periplasmic adaptor subunit [Kofleriaceae bacterium]